MIRLNEYIKQILFSSEYIEGATFNVGIISIKGKMYVDRESLNRVTFRCKKK